jgi:hypothetical protein
MMEAIRSSETSVPTRDTGRALQLLVTANVIPSSLILFTLMIEAIRSSKTSVPTRDTGRVLQLLVTANVFLAR